MRAYTGLPQEHTHDTSITSCGFMLVGDLDAAKVDDWIGKLMREKGVDLYRTKGVLALSGNNRKFVFQAVHMLFGGQDTVPWAAGEQRSSILVGTRIRGRFTCMCASVLEIDWTRCAQRSSLERIWSKRSWKQVFARASSSRWTRKPIDRAAPAARGLVASTRLPREGAARSLLCSVKLFIANVT